jgi:NADPH:quinone reductase-like Zn-dependent oxidoreductase
MKAIVIEEFGGPEVLRYTAVADPSGRGRTNPRDVEKALEAARAGQIRAMAYRTLPLSAAADAHRIVEQNRIAARLFSSRSR